MKGLHKDAELIRDIGVTVLAKRFGYTAQRVQNWLYRGIPKDILLNNAWLLKKKKSIKQLI